MFSHGLQRMDTAKTYISSVQRCDTVKTICQVRWMIGADGEYELRECMPLARLDYDVNDILKWVGSWTD